MAFHFSPKTVTDGLIFAVDAANQKSYPGTGTTANDLTNNNTTSTLVNGVGFDTTFGGAFEFDGTNDYVEISYSGDLTTQSFTFMFFAKSDVNSGNATTFLGLSNGGDFAFKTYAMQTWVNVNQFLAFVGNNGSYGTYNFYLDGDFRDWNFYCTVLTPTTIKTWINEDLKYDSNNSRRGSFDRIWIGSRGNAYFNGVIPNLMVYNRALTSQEVLQNYNATKGRFGL